MQRERLRLLRIESEEALDDQKNVIAMQAAREDLRDILFRNSNKQT